MFTYLSEDGVAVHVHEWLPEGEPRGVVQIAHGMGEHGARYEPLARALNEQGWAVYAADHRGHGNTMHAEPGELGDNGWMLLVADMVALTRLLRERYPDLPLVLIGHSLGSFATQQYLLDHHDLVDAAVLSGTAAVDMLFASPAHAGGDVDVMEVFNQAFQPVRTQADWLSRDEEQVDLYVADPWCGFSVDEANMAQLAGEAARLAAPSGIRPDLPIYVVVGEMDPVNDGLASSDAVVERYRQAGLTDLTYKVWPGARHEVFNEINRDEVFADLLAWIARVAP